MKIQKNNSFFEPVPTSMIWWIPLLTYFLLGATGTEFTDLEWLWWVCIPLLFIAWLSINFEITRK